MRARKLVVAALLSVSLVFQAMPEQAAEAALANPNDSCAAKELGNSTVGKTDKDGSPIGICRQLSLFGLRFSPKTVRIPVYVPDMKASGPNSLAGGSVKIYWRNGDRVDHQIMSFLVRDRDGLIISARSADAPYPLDTALCGGTCGYGGFDSAVLAARPDVVPGQKRVIGNNAGPAVFTVPGTYNFQCIIHPSMTQTIVITPVSKFR